MSNISKEIMSNLEEKFFNTLGKISEKIADNALGTCGAYFVYEPEFPEELIQAMKED